VATAPAEKFKEWAAETEVEPGQGIAARRGKWKISVASIKKSGEAFDTYNALRTAGYPAEILPAKAGEERVYSVRIANFESERDAKSVVEALKGRAELAKYDYHVGM
jgi:cell division septation protein DedD